MALREFFLDSNVATGGDGSFSTPFKYISELDWVAIDNFATANDDVKIYFKAGGIWRDTLTYNDVGTDSHPIVIGPYGAGDKPQILGSDNHIGLTADWVNQGGNIWRKSIGVVPPLVVVFDDILGFINATPTADTHWYYSNLYLYVYAPSNPSLYYKSIEAAQREGCVYVLNSSVSVISDIFAGIVNEDVWTFNNTTKSTLNNLEGAYANGTTSSNCFTSHQTPTINANGLIAMHSTIAIAFAQGSTVDARNIIVNNAVQGIHAGQGTHKYQSFSISDCTDSAIKSDQNTDYIQNTAVFSGGTIKNCYKACEVRNTSDMIMTLISVSIQGCTEQAISINNVNAELKITHVSLQHNAQSNGVYAYANNKISVNNSAIALGPGLASYRHALSLGAGVVYQGDNNLFWTNATNKTAINGVGISSITTHRTTTGQDTHSDFVDPQIISSGKLSPTSQCIDKGAFIAGVNMEGQLDPWGKKVYSIPNIGADQGAGMPKTGSRQILQLGSNRGFFS